MEFLDSLDLHVPHKKARRVRSWYLYEQYKSLEQNQSEAAQKLKDKTYQDRILHQELFERRARRNLNDPFGLCQSESGIGSCRSDSQQMSTSNEDFLEYFCDPEEDDETSEVGDTVDFLSSNCIAYQSDDKNVEAVKDDCSTNSLTSVVENQRELNLADDIKEELELAKKNIAENITLQQETLKESRECVEKYSKLCEGDEFSTKYEDDSSDCTIQDCKPVKARGCQEKDSDSNLHMMWSRLVSFAYQVTQLSHGNCYSDYSSQFLTAVLACDVLRRGISKMCDIFQHYVSPIKFATDDCDAVSSCRRRQKYVKRRKCVTVKKSKKCVNKCCQTKKRPKKCRYSRTCVTEVPSTPRWCLSRLSRKFCSENVWEHKSFESCGNEHRVVSEPRPSASNNKQYKPLICECLYDTDMKLSSEDLYSDSIKMTNPMLELANYMDSFTTNVQKSQL